MLIFINTEEANNDGRCTVEVSMRTVFPRWKRCQHKASQLASKDGEEHPVCGKHNSRLKRFGFQINKLIYV